MLSIILSKVPLALLKFVLTLVYSLFTFSKFIWLTLSSCKLTWYRSTRPLISENYKINTINLFEWVVAWFVSEWTSFHWHPMKMWTTVFSPSYSDVCDDGDHYPTWYDERLYYVSFLYEHEGVDDGNECVCVFCDSSYGIADEVFFLGPLVHLHVTLEDSVPLGTDLSWRGMGFILWCKNNFRERFGSFEFSAWCGSTKIRAQHVGNKIRVIILNEIKLFIPDIIF